MSKVYKALGVQDSQRYENLFKNQSIKLSKHCSLHYEDFKAASIITYDYTELWENDKEALGEMLIILTNWKSNKMNQILDFNTIFGTNLLQVIVEYDKEDANDFAKRFLSYINTKYNVDIKRIEEIDMFELDLANYDEDEKFIKINK